MLEDKLTLIQPTHSNYLCWGSDDFDLLQIPLISGVLWNGFFFTRLYGQLSSFCGLKNVDHVISSSFLCGQKINLHQMKNLKYCLTKKWRMSFSKWGISFSWNGIVWWCEKRRGSINEISQMEVIILLTQALIFAVGKQESFITLSAFFRAQIELNDPWRWVKQKPFERMSEIKIELKLIQDLP